MSVTKRSFSQRSVMFIPKQDLDIGDLVHEKVKEDTGLLTAVFEQNQLLQERIAPLECEKEDKSSRHVKEEFDKRLELMEAAFEKRFKLVEATFEKRCKSIEAMIDTLSNNIEKIGLAFLGASITKP